MKSWVLTLLGAAIILGVMAVPALARTLVVNQTSQAADDNGPGTEDKPFKTINAAAQIAQPGDTVLVHAGVYRERVCPANSGIEGKPITYRAAPGEDVYIKGSDIFQPQWQPVDGHPGVYIGSFEGLNFGSYNPYQQQHSAFKNRTCGQVFVDGERMREMDSLDEVYATPGSWAATAERDGVCVHFPRSTKAPQQHLVELTTRGRIFAPIKRGLEHIHIQGFIMEHCGNNYHRAFYAGTKTPQAGAVGCRGGRFWVIENNIIRWAKAAAIDCGDEGDHDLDGLDQPKSQNPGCHVIRHNVITDNGAAGIVGLKSLRTQIIGNRIERNNYLGIGMPETAGVKMHFFVDGLIEGNLFRDNETYGVWLDNVYQGARVTRNVFLNNKDAGIFIEMGGPPGVLIDNNVVAYTWGVHNSAGLYSHDAGGILAVHNLFFANASYGVYMRMVSGRSYSIFPEGMTSWQEPSGRAPCEPVHLKLYNNLMLDNTRGAISMPGPGPKAHDNDSDYNLFSSGGMMLWMHLTPFVANTAGGLKEDELVAAMDKAYQDKGIAEAERRKPLIYHKGILLDLKQWQTLMGFDLHSRSAPIRNQSLCSSDLLFEVEITEEALAQMGCKSIPGVDRDFFGNPIPNDNPLPGPFQHLRKGQNRFVLWPVPLNEEDRK